MKRLIVLCSLVVLGLLMVVGITSACGGFFCTNTPVDQSAERIIFEINGDGTITATVGIDYEGAAEDFSWVVPVPTPPELDVAPTSALDVLQNATNPQINPPANYCRGVVWTSDGFGGGGGGYLEEGNLGPYDYAIIGSDDPRELIDWLRDNGYIVTEAMEPIIAEYVVAGMYFLAMKLSNDAEVGDIQPVVMTYKSIDPMVPIKLTAVAALNDMPVLVWIFADTPYSPENYVHAEVPFATFRTQSQLTTPFNFSDATADYLQARNDIQVKHDGRAFITEYAMPSVNLMEINASVADESYLTDLINEHSFVTRLRAQLSPEQMTFDPVFVPDTLQNHVPQTIELGDYVDPLHYWGCTTRELDTREGEQLLANSVLLPTDTILPGQATFRFPAGWIQSSITYHDIPLTVYAPQTVTPEILDEYFFDGVSPFLMVLQYKMTADIYYSWYPQIFELGQDYERPDTVTIWQFDYSPLFSDASQPEIGFFFLTTKSAQEGSQKIYNAMTTHLRSYTYYAHPQLRNTLALAELVEDYYGQSVLMGFPEGWTEYFQPGVELPEWWEVVISPDDGGSGRIELIRSSAFSGVVEGDDMGRAELTDDYSLDEDIINSMRAFNERNCHQTGVAKFDNGDRVGYLRAINGWLVVASAVPEEFPQYDETLRQIAESFSNGYGCQRG